MSRLIDADALLQKMEIETCIHNGNDLWHFTGIKAMITCEPTVDPVAHGKWLINCDGYYPYCSVCKEEPENGHIGNYCPNCGAKMDLKEEE